MELPTELARALTEVRSVGAVTGAGVSAESGIQTYRGKGGIYDDEEEGDSTVEALSAPMLQRDPNRTWRVVAQLARASVGSEPNAGHLALARLERHVERFTLLTQNVDGLHRAAGSRNVIDIHGDVLDIRCMACSNRGRLERDELPDLDAAPACDACGGIMRPDAVLFGEMLPEAKLLRIREAFYEDVPDLVVIAGTTAVFPYIAEPVVVAERVGRLTVEVNPEPTLLSDYVGFSLRGKAGELLPLIADAVIGS